MYYGQCLIIWPTIKILLSEFFDKVNDTIKAPKVIDIGVQELDHTQTLNFKNDQRST